MTAKAGKHCHIAARMLTKSRRIVGKTRSSRLGRADGPQDGYQTQNVTHLCAVCMQVRPR